MTDTLVVSAWEPEIAPLLRALRARDRAGARAVAAAPVGVGAVEAAAGAARLIAAERPRRVIFVGTAGVYPSAASEVGLGGVALANDLLWVSTASLRGEGYLPAPAIARAKASARLRSAIARAGTARLESVPVACPTAITRSAALGRRIVAATGAVLENLEAFSVARAAAGAKGPRIELAVVLGVANRVGPNGHREWRAHHRAASWAACAAIRHLLDEYDREEGSR